MSIELNQSGYQQARSLIETGMVVDDLHGDWSEINPGTTEQNQFLADNGIVQFGNWHLGVDPDKNPETKEAYSFPYGDYRRVYRSGLIAIEERAAQYGHEDIREAARKLLELVASEN